MVDLSVLPGFLGVILVFLIPPGPDMAYMLAVRLEGGRRAALKATHRLQSVRRCAAHEHTSTSAIMRRALDNYLAS